MRSYCQFYSSNSENKNWSRQKFKDDHQNVTLIEILNECENDNENLIIDKISAASRHHLIHFTEKTIEIGKLESLDLNESFRKNFDEPSTLVAAKDLTKYLKKSYY